MNSTVGETPLLKHSKMIPKLNLKSLENVTKRALELKSREEIFKRNGSD